MAVPFLVTEHGTALFILAAFLSLYHRWPSAIVRMNQKVARLLRRRALFPVKPRSPACASVAGRKKYVPIPPWMFDVFFVSSLRWPQQRTATERRPYLSLPWVGRSLR